MTNGDSEDTNTERYCGQCGAWNGIRCIHSGSFRFGQVRRADDLACDKWWDRLEPEGTEKSEHREKYLKEQGLRKPTTEEIKKWALEN